MKKHLISMLCLLLSAGIAFTQPKPKTTVKQSVPELTMLMTGIGLPYKMINDSVAAIPYEGENIASYQVVVQKVSDLYIVYTNLSEALPGKIDNTKFKYLLQRNNHFDIVKIGLSEEDDTVYLRADVYKAGMTTALLARIIKQVANVSNIIGGDLK